MEKLCRKCGVVKPVSEFTVRPRMADGYRNECKHCMTLYQNKWRQRLGDGERLKYREHKRAYRCQPHVLARTAATVRVWRETHPEHVLAHNNAREAVRKMILVSPGRCESCGIGEARLEKHHPDYSQPLFVIWLCKPCHLIADSVRRSLEAAAI